MGENCVAATLCLDVWMIESEGTKIRKNTMRNGDTERGQLASHRLTG